VVCLGSGDVEVKLSCTHIMLILPPFPQKDDKVWCIKCDMPRKVIWVKQWKVRCTMCRYARTSGSDKTLSLRRAQDHFDKTGHTLKVGRYGELKITVGHNDTTQSSLEL
jgi:hypothetical protein